MALIVRKRIIEILRLIKEKLESNTNTVYGLCNILSELYLTGKITQLEKTEMEDYLDTYEPIWSRFFKEYPYWWDMGKRKPRIKWVKRRLFWEKLKIWK